MGRKMCLDQLVSEVKLVEQSVTDLVVRQITLHALLYALQIRDSLHLNAQLLSTQLAIPVKLTLQHARHWIPLKFGHWIEQRLTFFPARLQ